MSSKFNESWKLYKFSKLHNSSFIVSSKAAVMNITPHECKIITIKIRKATVEKYPGERPCPQTDIEFLVFIITQFARLPVHLIFTPRNDLTLGH